MGKQYIQTMAITTRNIKITPPTTPTAIPIAGRVEKPWVVVMLGGSVGVVYGRVSVDILLDSYDINQVGKAATKNYRKEEKKPGV